MSKLVPTISVQLNLLLLLDWSLYDRNGRANVRFFLFQFCLLVTHHCLLAAYTNCAKCHKQNKPPHNCRVCGALFCEKCTTKCSVELRIPESFEKTGKPGNQRVCDRCRWLVGKGAQCPADQEGPPRLERSVLGIDRASELTNQFLKKLQRAACANCDTTFHLLNKRHDCNFCGNSFCQQCIDGHLQKEALVLRSRSKKARPASKMLEVGKPRPVLELFAFFFSFFAETCV